MLGELLDLHALAHDVEYLLPRTSGNGVGPIGGSRERPIGINVDALDLDMGNDALAILEEWERWWREHWDLAPYGEASSARLLAPYSDASAGVDSTPTSRNLTGTVAFLRARWPIASQVIEPPPDEFAHEVRKLHSRALAALALTRFDIDPDPEAVEPWDYTIACPADLGDRLCNHSIGMRRQPRPVDGGKPEPVRVNCPRCGSHWDTRTLFIVALAAGTRVELTLAEAREHYGCTERTIRRKVAAGLLTHHKGRYRIGHAEAQDA
jgi:hypothetical protein